MNLFDWKNIKEAPEDNQFSIQTKSLTDLSKENLFNNLSKYSV
jgi:hypothetical protein